MTAPPCNGLVQWLLPAVWVFERSGAVWQQCRDLPAQLKVPIHMTDLVQCFLPIPKGSLAATKQAQLQFCSLSDLGQCLPLEPGVHLAKVLDVAGRPDGAGQHAPAQRAVCNHNVQALSEMRRDAGAWQK